MCGAIVTKYLLSNNLSRCHVLVFTNFKLSRKNEFDRKAAVLRRLNMAEELFNDIQKTPKPAVSQIDEANRSY